MEKWIDKIFSLKKFPGQLVFVIWISSSLLVILPDDILERILLKDFKVKYAEFVGPTFLLCSAISLFMIVKYLIDKANDKKYIKVRKENILKWINRLSFHEVVVLREFILNNKTTILAPFNDETVISLENKGLIYKAAQSAVISGVDMGYPFSITEFVYNNLTNNHLGLPNNLNNMNDDLIRKIISERPTWAKDIENRQQKYRKYVSM